MVVGASQGLGEALTVRFYQRGHQVVAASRNTEKLTELKSRLVHLRIFPSDVTNPKSMKDLMEYTNNEYGGISTLVFVAGVNFDDVVADWEDTSAFQRVVEVNLIGAANALHAVLPFLSASPNAQVVVITSLAGVFGCVPGGTAYAASKAGLDAFFCSAAPELKALGINVLLVDAGSMEMPLGTEGQVIGSGSRYRERRSDAKRGKPVEFIAERICDAVEKGKSGRMWSTYRIFVIGVLFVKICFPSLMERMALRVRFKNGGALPHRLRFPRRDSDA